MTTRKLGNSGLEIPALVFGGNVFGWTADESTSFRLLDALLDAGLNCIDTADVYSRWVPGHQGGESETLIGKWLKRTGKRDRMVIASKVGMDMGNGHKGLSAAYIEQALERSLRRLQTDYLDLYQSHTDDPHTDLEETLSTYGELIKKGKVRVIGASNYDARRRLPGTARGATEQIAEDATQPAARGPAAGTTKDAAQRTEQTTAIATALCRTALARHQHGHQPDQQGHFRIASTSLSFRATQRRTENRIEQSHWSSS